MALRTLAAAKPRLQAGLKLARLFELPERDVEDLVRELESKALFQRLRESGVVSLEPYPNARFVSARRGGPGLETAGDGLPPPADEGGDLAGVIQRVGQERFEQCFLRDELLSDAQRAGLCGISAADAGRLRRYVDQLLIRAEFEERPEGPAPAKFYSAVAGIDLEGGRPVLGFFHREVWKGRYRIDPDKRRELLASLPAREARRVERLLGKLEWLDRRKSTLYRVLETLVKAQADYLATQNPDLRRPLTQREVAAGLGVGADVLNRIIANKSLRLPSGREAPIKILVPSAKSLNRDRLYHLAVEHPGLSDEGLRRKMKRLYGARLSRRSVAQYRKELGLGGRGQRTRNADMGRHCRN